MDPELQLDASRLLSAPTAGVEKDHLAVVVDDIMSRTCKGTDYGLDLGGFELLGTLGIGSFGTVLLVHLAPASNATV